MSHKFKKVIDYYKKECVRIRQSSSYDSTIYGATHSLRKECQKYDSYASVNREYHDEHAWYIIIDQWLFTFVQRSKGGECDILYRRLDANDTLNTIDDAFCDKYENMRTD